MTRTKPFMVVAALACFSTLGASAAGRPPITQAASGKTIRLAKGASATLRLSNDWRWSEPRASTRAVELTPVDYLVDPGFREWKVDARARGTARIRSAGKPSRTGRTPRRFTLTVVVGSG